MDWGIGEALKIMGWIVLIGVIVIAVGAFFIGRACV